MKKDRIIHKIASRSKSNSLSSSDAPQRKVAAYTRVSTDDENQLLSNEAQMDYYKHYIAAHPDWVFAGLYVDKGITGTSTKKREGFNRMIKDALAGKIDLIITKSISRFARNTVDMLTTIRNLKDAGVEVFFEKENIYTLDSKGELFITIISSIAQEESRNISENVAWGRRKRMADGIFHVPYARFLGYEQGENHLPQIIESEAGIVRQIYAMFLQGKTPSYIAKCLTQQKIPSPAGKEIWYSSTVENILTNEKYCGCALLQKTFTENFLTKKQKINNGELPKYYIENSHKEIVSKAVFNLVQEEMQNRKESKYHSAQYCFSSKIICGDCGNFYGSKVWHSNSNYRCRVWQCNHRYEQERKCRTPHLYEHIIRLGFMEIMCNYLLSRPDIISTCQSLVFSSLHTRNKTANNGITKADRQNNISSFLNSIQQEQLLSIPFDELLWCSVIDKVICTSKNELVYCLKDCSHHTWPIIRYTPIQQKNKPAR